MPVACHSHLMKLHFSLLPLWAAGARCPQWTPHTSLKGIDWPPVHPWPWVGTEDEDQVSVKSSLGTVVLWWALVVKPNRLVYFKICRTISWTRTRMMMWKRGMFLPHTLTRTRLASLGEAAAGQKTSHNFHNSHHLTIETWPDPDWWWGYHMEGWLLSSLGSSNKKDKPQGHYCNLEISVWRGDSFQTKDGWIS